MRALARRLGPHRTLELAQLIMLEWMIVIGGVCGGVGVLELTAART